MPKKSPAYSVAEDLSDLFLETPSPKTMSDAHSPTILSSLDKITRQMKAAGLRDRTISDYNIHVSHFVKITGLNTIDEIKVDHIYEWLSSMNVSNQTKLTRLKCLKAFLSRCFNFGWIDSKFWIGVNVKVDSPVKEGATEKDLYLLLRLLDLSRFVELRDATAALMMYQTGIRIGTLTQLESRHVDLDDQLLKIGGDLMKNHESLYLPFDDRLKRLIKVLMNQNELIRQRKYVNNDLLFITQNGRSVSSTPTNNNIQKRLKKYSDEFGLKNISPHALRRGFAKRLLNQKANIAVISKALGHSNIEVTTRYLHLDKEEVADSLRNYL